MRFFGPGAERAAIDILAIIDWAEEYVKLLATIRVLDIPSFLRRPFVMGKAVVHPIPEDPTEALLREKCVRTKAQKAWTYFLRPIAILDRPRDHCVRRDPVWRTSPARQSDD